MPAIDYLQSCLLPDGRLARFYELQTNKPLYFTRDYQLTYDDSDVPTHYGFKVPCRLEALAKQMALLSSANSDELKLRRDKRFQVATRRPSTQTVDAILMTLDPRGAWVEDGRLRYHGGSDDTRRVIDSATFIRNLSILSSYLDSRPAN